MAAIRDRHLLRFGAVYFVMFTIFGVSSPYLQLLVHGLGYDPASVGVLLGLFEIAGLAGPLFLGGISDRSPSARPVLLALALVSALALIPLILLPRFAVTVLSLAVMALGIRGMSPFLDAAAVSYGERGKPGRAEYGKIRVFGSAGFIVMALILQALPGFDRSPPWRIALFLGITTAAFIASLLFLPRGNAARVAPRAEERERRRIDPVFALGILIIALGRIAMAPISSFLSLYVTEDLKWNAVGGLWALSACAEMPLMVVSGRIIRKTGPMGAVAIASAAVALRLGIYALFPSPAGVVVGQLFHSLSYGLFQPAAVAFVALRVPPERRSRGMVVFMSLGVGLPTFLGSALGGQVIQAGGYRLLFASFTIFAVASLVLYLFTRPAFSEALPP